MTGETTAASGETSSVTDVRGFGGRPGITGSIGDSNVSKGDPHGQASLFLCDFIRRSCFVDLTVLGQFLQRHFRRGVPLRMFSCGSSADACT